MSSLVDTHIWRLARTRLFISVDIILILVTAAYLFGFRMPSALEYLPFAIGLVAFGLPHGAVDHLVPARLSGNLPSLRSVLSVVLLYLVLGSAVVALWDLIPLAAFVVFIAMTLYHWGQGDLFASTMREDAHPISRGSRIGMLLVRGGLPMIVPLVAFPQTYLEVLRQTTRVFSGSPAAVNTFTMPDPRLRTMLVVTLLLLALAPFVTTFPLGGARGSLRAWTGDLGEVALLAVFFATVPPILAIGLYFCLWHSLRHIVRLSALDPKLRADAVRGRFGIVLVRFTLRAAPFTLVALAMLAVILVAIPSPATGPGSLLGVYLVLISALTLPHVVIVTMMDRRQGVWAATESSLTLDQQFPFRTVVPVPPVTIVRNGNSAQGLPAGSNSLEPPKATPIQPILH